MNPLSEESKKRLTKYMDGCAHIWVRDGHVSHHTCSECGEELSVRKEFLPKMRSFTTGNDMYALKCKIVEKGEGEEFIKFSYMKWVYPETQVKINPATILAIRSSAGFDLWLINPSIFIPLVDEWLKEKEKRFQHTKVFNAIKATAGILEGKP